MSCGWRALILVLLPLVLHAVCLAVAPGREMARRDWYLRESLRAIRDWEAILAEWEQATPEEQRTPALPVPTDGEAVEWPNPIPLRLLPDEDHGRRVHTRLAESKAARRFWATSTPVAAGGTTGTTATIAASTVSPPSYPSLPPLRSDWARRVTSGAARMCFPSRSAT